MMLYYKAIASESTDWCRLDDVSQISYVITTYSPDFNYPMTLLKKATGTEYQAQYNDCTRPDSRWVTSDQIEFDAARSNFDDLFI